MAGRPRSIDRDKVLDAAEGIVAAEGAAGLTFDAVARAAGITKGGVQYCFGTKDKLIEAMIDRWSADNNEASMLAVGLAATMRPNTIASAAQSLSGKVMNR